MDSPRRILRVSLASGVCCAMLLVFAATLWAATFPEFVDPNPAPGNGFGTTIVVLSTGNVVITSPNDDAGGSNAGAVYLFNGSTGALISTLRGSTASDQIGSGGVTALSNGNYVIGSPLWDNGGFTNVGAATWGNGSTGVSGVVSVANSLIGSLSNDQVGYGVTALTNGNYVVSSPNWTNVGVAGAGAATWGNGASGVTGTISASNSLVGSKANDFVGVLVIALSNGNYVVRSSSWDNGSVVDAGAVTWGNGTSGVVGVVSGSNSLVGTTTADGVGNTYPGVLALPSGNYVVTSANWDNGGTADAGAVTWGSGTTGVTGAVSAANSLVGTHASDQISNGGITVLSNGNYVVSSNNWDNGAITNAGAATWCSGTAMVVGAVSSANSLVGSTANDQVGGLNLWVTVLSNGNYVVSAPYWDNGGVADAGAATWGNGTTGTSGTISAANSLVGSTAGDNVGSVSALTNGNYVVASASWDFGGIVNAGAATWGNGATGVAGTISSGNSLVGSKASDFVGYGGVTPLTNGNYVVASWVWGSGSASQVGAATWGNGTSGLTGVVSSLNSLVGSIANDRVSSGGVTALSNGSYVVCSPFMNTGTANSVGAATWGSGTSGVSGVVSTSNSLMGAKFADQVSSAGVTALTNGNYVVRSPAWDFGTIANTGAVTWGSGTAGVTGLVSAANSLVGSTANDSAGYVFVGGVADRGVTALPNGDYVVSSSHWDNGALVNAGAATWGSGTTGVSGAVSIINSLVGSAANANLQPALAFGVSGTFMSPFLGLGGGRVFVGPVNTSPVITTAVDIPSDQGGWLRLTYTRTPLDDANATLAVTMYGVWRHVPGTLPARLDRSGAEAAPAFDHTSIERMLASLPKSLGAAVAGGTLSVTGRSSPPNDRDAAFPTGTWELVASVPALQQAQYVVAVPTISNAAACDYVVTAHTTTPSVWVISNVMSGQSVDNLAPAPPAQFSGAYSSGQTNLQWAANSEPDLGHYSLYRGTSADFVPSAGNRIAMPTGISYADVGPAGGYYKLSAVDVNGNESSFALVTPGSTAVARPDAPVIFAIEPLRPNPARGDHLDVTFSLPAGTAAWLELLDVSGRRTLAREVGSLGVGRHTVNLGDARRVAAGIYWVRLTQGANQRGARVAVIE